MLYNGQAFVILVWAEPRQTLDEISAHVVRERHRAAEAAATQREKVSGDLPERRSLHDSAMVNQTDDIPMTAVIIASSLSVIVKPV